MSLNYDTTKVKTEIPFTTTRKLKHIFTHKIYQTHGIAQARYQYKGDKQNDYW